MTEQEVKDLIKWSEGKCTEYRNYTFATVKIRTNKGHILTVPSNGVVTSPSGDYFTKIKYIGFSGWRNIK